MGRKKTWGEVERVFIEKNAGTLKDKELAEQLAILVNRPISLQSIRKQRQKLGILKESGRGKCGIRDASIANIPNMIQPGDTVTTEAGDEYKVVEGKVQEETKVEPIVGEQKSTAEFSGYVDVIKKVTGPTSGTSVGGNFDPVDDEPRVARLAELDEAKIGKADNPGEMSAELKRVAEANSKEVERFVDDGGSVPEGGDFDVLDTQG